VSKGKDTQGHWGQMTALSLLFVVALAAALGVLQVQRVRTGGLPAEFPAPVADADVAALGANVSLEQYGDAELDAALGLLSDAHFVWIRQSFYWRQIETAPGHFDWSSSDRILAHLSDYRSLRLVAVLDDRLATPPRDHSKFASFAREFALRYGDRIDYYQVWDNPNLADHWDGRVNPADYADLLAQSAIAIRSVDSGARILLGGLSPTLETGPQNLNDVRYLEQLYQAGAAPYFDIVAAKPYGFDTGPDDRRVDDSVLNFSRVVLLRKVMETHGDAGKAVWASNWGWNALPDGWTGQPSIWGATNEQTQAARTVAALERARTEWPWCGALILENFQPPRTPGGDFANDPRWGFALVRQDGTPRPVSQAIQAWSEALPAAAPAGGYPAINPWARYEGDWRLGPIGADVGAAGGRASFDFEGTSVAITVRRGPYRAYLTVTLDGQPAPALPQDREGRATIPLYEDRPSISTIPLAVDLDPGLHRVEITTERGQGQWLLVDWRVGAPAQGTRSSWVWVAAALTVLALAALAARQARRTHWRELSLRFQTLPEWQQISAAVVLTGAEWALAGSSWACVAAGATSTPLTYAALAASLVLLPVLTIVLSFRPDIGLGLVVGSAPFYLQPASLLQVLSLPELLVLLSALGVLINRLGTHHRAAEQRERIGLIDAGVILLMTAAGISSLAAADRAATLYELRTIFIVPGIFYVLLRTQRLDDKARRRLIGAYLCGAAAVAAIGIVWYALGTHTTLAEAGLRRMQSVYPSPNNAAIYLARTWPLLAAWVVWARTKRGQLLALAGLAILSLGLGLTFSRGALILGIPAGMLTMGWLAGRRYRTAAILLVLLGALALIPLLTVPRFASLLDFSQGSTFFRLELWRSSLTMIREHVLAGIGPGNFQQAYQSRYVLPSAWAEPNLSHPHNILLDHWTRLGLLGSAGGVMIQIGFWRTLLRVHKAQASAHRTGFAVIGLAGSMAVLLAHGLVDNTLFAPDLALAFFLMLAVLRGLKTQR